MQPFFTLPSKVCQSIDESSVGGLGARQAHWFEPRAAAMEAGREMAHPPADQQ
jgi:hypothetical protein